MVSAFQSSNPQSGRHYTTDPSTWVQGVELAKITGQQTLDPGWKTAKDHGNRQPAADGQKTSSSSTTGSSPS